MAENPLSPRHRKHHPWGWRITLAIAIAALIILPLRGLSNSSPLLGLNNSGAAVKELQESLKEKGFNPGPLDGHFGIQTEKAVYYFQKSRGLRADGIVGEETWKAIAANATASEPTPQASPTASPTPAAAENQAPKPPVATPVVATNVAAPKPGANSPYSPDISQILDRGTLVVAMLGVDSPPFFQVDSPETPCAGDDSTHVIQDGQMFCGLDVELSKGLAKELGVEVRFDRQAETFNDVVNMVFEHRADIAVSKISRTLSRTQKVIFSRPYLNMRQALLVNRVQFAQQAKGRRPELVIRDLTGNVGAIAGSSYVGFTQQKFPLAQVKEYPSWEDAVQSARKGEIIAAYRDELEVKRIILQDPDTALNFQTVVLTDTNDAIAMVLPWDSQQLREFVNQYLETNQIDYTADSLLEKYSELLAQQKSSTVSSQSGGKKTS